ncbi:Antibiotic biosynthesis monooxygenase [Chryseobacterium taklimakanense]|uniref:Antibiotic biosynthesis monooxygenase n=1 Tax=Chryseobacterium taklimakanense TaxID=536441 RepID=A0A239WCB3_9FLAO|nr:antibiotic biosynthesis monooxygenase family protein [Chryseobacterium taklimakanense]SNV32142.1 Antibiotic biosynthesis monooxygenase [Chryseobacterium taklimakanense]SNV32157.1 Antibiotic biosynthesis monooxygenase [Chryseobacterium taklimakanense]
MYLLQGKLTAKDGKRDELAEILKDASKLISNAEGSKFYIVGKCEEDKNDVYVTELWNTKEDHDNSLNYPGVRELIMKAMPILDGQPEKGKEIEVLNEM